MDRNTGLGQPSLEGAEQKLRDSETRFHLMADSIPQIVWITDAAGNNEFLNRQWYLYTGAPLQPAGAGSGAGAAGP